jgi:hypothetical protein
MPSKIKHNMQSLLKRGKTFLTPTASSAHVSADGFTHVKTDSALFPRPDPSIDGEECLQDCSTCTIHYPSKFSIDEDDKLYGHVNGWDTHLIVGTGKTDWVRDVTDEEGSVMQAVGKYGQEYQRSGGLGKAKLMLSASNMPTGGEHGDCDMDAGSNCLLLPSWQFVEHVLPAEVEDLMREIVERSATNKTLLKESQRRKSESDGTTQLSQPKEQNGSATEPAAAREHGATTERNTEDTDPPPLDELTLSPSRRSIPPSKFLTRTRPIPHSAIILMCSHKTRDARCGQSAPLLRKELERHLRPLGLYRDLHDERPGGVGIYYINHVGGHKYSANVMVYRRQGSLLGEETNQDTPKTMYGEAVQGIWLARVKPEDCENIVKQTVLKGKVVQPGRQLRGGFDRERGLASW